MFDNLFNISKAVQALIYVASIVIMITGFVLRNSKNKKFRTYAEKWNGVASFILDAIEEAEKWVRFEGEDKKERVLTKTHQYCMNNKITYDNEKAKKILERYVKATQRVNVKEDSGSKIIQHRD